MNTALLSFASAAVPAAHCRRGGVMNEATKVRVSSEEESRRLAEESREKEWAGRTFLRELFLGNFLLPLVFPFPVEQRENPEFTKFYNDLKAFLRNEVDSIAIDESGEYPE